VKRRSGEDEAPGSRVVARVFVLFFPSITFRLAVRSDFA
jgi:hypothetical protein